MGRINLIFTFIELCGELHKLCNFYFKTDFVFHTTICAHHDKVQMSEILSSLDPTIIMVYRWCVQNKKIQLSENGKKNHRCVFSSWNTSLKTMLIYFDKIYFQYLKSQSP